MKRITIAVVSVMVVAALILGASTVMARKPQAPRDVIAKSNGFPSGPHFNLNIHGKDPSTFTCDATEGGNSIFVSDNVYDETTIQYASNKRSSDTGLKVLDPCAMPPPYGDGVAKVQLPYKVIGPDGMPIPANGYYVFARILGKPNNGDLEPRSNIILYPNQVVKACNDPGNDEFPSYTDCPEDPELALGLILKDATYYAGEEAFYRFEDPTAKKRGKSKAVDITHLLTYTGWVVDARLDTELPYGEIDINDIPEDDYDNDPAAPNNRDYNGDGVEDEDDVAAWLLYWSSLPEPMTWHFANTWIFNIADLVITEQGLVNDGTKLVQIRFYPVATTEFKPRQHIIVKKATDPVDYEREFEFKTNYGSNFFLRHGGSSISEALVAGTYAVEELVPEGWAQPNVTIEDPDGGSSSSGSSATIDLDPDETVIVTFSNRRLPTNLWVNFYGLKSTLNGQPLPVGTVIRAYDPQGVICGEFSVTHAGWYGLMPVYGDDPLTEVDEGAATGDRIKLTVNGVAATVTGPDEPVWVTFGDLKQVNLAVSARP